MSDKSETNYENWLKKAEEDELSINAILNNGGSPSTACFLSQQVAEKCLKALIVFYNKDFPKIHDLNELETIILALEPDIKSLHQELSKLTIYYIETRYPGDYPEFTFEEAKQAFEAAKRVKDFILKKISS